MWDKKAYWAVVLSAVAVLAGCQARASWYNADVRPVRVSKEDVAAFNEAVSLTEALRYDEAAAKFQQVAGRFASAGDRPRAAEAWFWLGFCREKQGRTTETRAIYMLVSEEYSETPAAREAAERLSRLPGRSPE